MKCLMCTAAVLCAALLAVPVRAEDKPALKEIPTKDLKVAHPKDGKVTAPTVIKTAEELEKSPVLKDAADAVKKHVDFAKEKLVVFAWGGSGGDRLAATLKADGKTAEFSYTPGLTLDLHMHAKLFVVPKDAEVKVTMVR
jgi:hypothetical protein